MDVAYMYVQIIIIVYHWYDTIYFIRFNKQLTIHILHI